MRDLMLIRSSHLGWNSVRLAVEATEAVQVIADVGTVMLAEHFARLRRPDIVIAGDDVKGVSVVPVLGAIREILGSQAQLVVLTAQVDPADLIAFEPLRLSGLLLWKDVTDRTLPHYLLAAMDAEVAIMSQTLLDIWYDARLNRTHLEELAARITPRERATLERLAAGHTIEQIALDLQTSSRTVRRDITSLMEKLDASDRFTLGVRSVQLGIVPLID